MTKRTFSIEWDDDNGPLWMNTSNLLLCLTHYCRNSRFTVCDVTGDGESDTRPESSGPVGFSEPSTLAVEIAARVWCDQEMGNVTMDSDAAMEIARIIHRVRCEHAEKQSYDDLAASGGILNAP